MRYHLTLEDTYRAMEKCDGALVPSASALDVPIHTLKSFIAKHAELQALAASRDLKIEDISRDRVLYSLTDENVSTADKITLSKWSLENLASTVYSKKNTVAIEEKPTEELSEEELKKRIKVAQARIAGVMPEDTNV